MKYKLLCIDIDGTLLDDKKRLPLQVKESLRKVSDMGVHIALASGRMPAGVELVERELGIECIKICNAGTYILIGNQCIGAEWLSIDSMRDVYRKVAEKNRVPLWIFRDKNWYVTQVDPYVEREMKIISFTPKVADVDALAKQWGREGKLPNKLLIAADPERIPLIYQDIKEKIRQDIDIACSSEMLLEIFPSGVDKGKALKKVCGYMNIAPEEVVAFGDQELDIPLIETAGIGIAMGNAIPALKEMADFVTKSNNEAGVAYALENYLS